MKLNELKTIFSALADETRLRILSLLGEGELCVCDLMRVLQEPQSKISRHLSYLRRSGLVSAKKKGLWMYYRLSKPSNQVCEEILKSLNQGRADFEQLQKDHDEFYKNKSCLVACCE